ncbi:TIGR03089 family protein [Micromonospora inyonensis]|uniref:TIGR03089 family protein n=1 Tax=Micromonospora inyonensis TaxID=47866 RepID=A0A1C6SE00_9ACTN|nr:TIGR03089 family protein [Micromonospora inyonensis]SCL27661.1 TIGR03089 family protein [Micromonospora inyonensis]
MTMPAVDLPGLPTAGADQPLLTYYDDATGERTTLTATELGAWAARTTGLLRDGCRLRAGDRAAVLLPPHWQTAAVLLGCWAAGVAVSYRGRATAGLPTLGPGGHEPLDASFVHRPRIDDWLDNPPEATHRFVLGLGPLGAPTPPPPTGYLDFVTELDLRSAAPPPVAVVRRSDAASVDGTSYAQWGEVARAVAEAGGLRPGDRILVDAAVHDEPVKWLLAPLAAGASVVVCANCSPERRAALAAAEQVTRVL